MRDHRLTITINTGNVIIVETTIMIMAGITDGTSIMGKAMAVIIISTLSRINTDVYIEEGLSNLRMFSPCLSGSKSGGNSLRLACYGIVKAKQR
jgi:hypothetical protein